MAAKALTHALNFPTASTKLSLDVRLGQDLRLDVRGSDHHARQRREALLARSGARVRDLGRGPKCMDDDAVHASFALTGPDAGTNAGVQYIASYRPQVTPARAWTTPNRTAAGVAGVSVTVPDAGGPYESQVAARNSEGQGRWSSPQVLLATQAPAVPCAAKATAARSRVTVKWSAPVSDGGSPVTDHTVEVHSRAAGSTWSSWSSLAHAKGAPGAPKKVKGRKRAVPTKTGKRGATTSSRVIARNKFDKCAPGNVETTRKR